ncbi:LsmAD domain [Macleaya cordata]|uniref:LsmAD domain n=1 Tax=Macleaya cordata TaxID=56857 RepID=A0A200QEI6_MACCD|nr:LsmAD domain [Macleaya cordata]
MQQVIQPRASANGFGRRRAEKESGNRLDNKSQFGKSNTSNFTSAGLMHGSKLGGYDSPSRDRLVYLATCLIGHQVEVQVKNGSIFSGIFHATNAEKDFGIILKMARLTKDGSFRGQNAVSDSVNKAPSKTLIIPAKELVQVMAKDVPLTGNDLTKGLQHERRQDIMIDSYISKSHLVEVERVLERWTPDENDSQCPEYENIFDGTWNRLKWDQFETNEALFGVKSTFDEELYTTKLIRGPQMRELEREALRIAREIEGEDTLDLHLAEERGLHFLEDFNIDEETRFSSVFRGFDDSGYEEDEVILDSENTETFGASSSSLISKSSDLARGKYNDGAIASSTCSSVDEEYSSQLNAGRDLSSCSSNDQARQLHRERWVNDNQFEGHHQETNCPKEFTERKILLFDVDIQSSVDMKKATPDKGGLSSRATSYAPSSCASSMGQECMGSLAKLSDSAGPGKAHGAYPRKKPGISTSSTSDRVTAAPTSTSPGLSPSSSIGSLSSEKSRLNPYAKEFKLNPNAKSFTPSQTPLRPPSPVAEGSFYFPTNVPAVQHMHGVPVGIGIGPSYTGPQPVMYGSQSAPIAAPQAFIHPNCPMYGQQMILGHPRQVLYMPSYPTTYGEKAPNDRGNPQRFVQDFKM